MRERIGHFRIERRLGEGGMGIVFAAHDERLDRPVAIKMIRQAGDTVARERFWREARAAARLNHPHVCQIHDVDEIDGELYIAMELLEGESLADRMARGPLSLQEAGPIALATADRTGARTTCAADALQRALALNPDLTRAQAHQAAFEVERGRSLEVLEQLLGRLRSRRSDPELLAAIVHACRYTGLLHASLAAHAEARRLDPNVRTSAMYTYWMLGDYERSLAESTDHEGYLFTYALASMGRVPEAIACMREMEEKTEGVRRAGLCCHRAALEGKKEESLAAIRLLQDSSFRDPEGRYHSGRTAALIGEPELAIDILRSVVAGGFYCDRTMAQDPWLDSIRSHPGFLELHRAAEAGRRRASRIFFEAEGDKLLGVGSP